MRKSTAKAYDMHTKDRIYPAIASLMAMTEAGIDRQEATVCRAVEEIPGVESAKASASRNTLTIKGRAAEDAFRSAVEKAGYTFKGNRTK